MADDKQTEKKSKKLEKKPNAFETSLAFYYYIPVCNSVVRR